MRNTKREDETSDERVRNAQCAKTNDKVETTVRERERANQYADNK